MLRVIERRFAVWSVVKVPFPYADRPVRQHRPALVIAAPEVRDTFGLIWVLMITSAENRPWPGDVPIGDFAACGLPAASVVRTTRIATIDTAAVEPLGQLSAALQQGVQRELRITLAGISLR